MSDDGRQQAQVRVLRIVAELTQAPATVKELATRHRIGVKTIRRDLEAIAEAGLPLVGV